LVLIVGSLALLGLALWPAAVAADQKLTKKDMPAPVLAAFEKAYPSATVKGYGKEVEKGKTFYEIESVNGGNSLDISYLPDGTVAEIEQGVTEGDLPAPVKDAVAKKHPDGKIEKAEKATRGAVVQYDVKIATGNAKVEMSIDPTGKVISEKTLGGAKKPTAKA
jgi:hypothetical protein